MNDIASIAALSLGCAAFVTGFLSARSGLTWLRHALGDSPYARDWALDAAFGWVLTLALGGAAAIIWASAP